MNCADGDLQGHGTRTRSSASLSAGEGGARRELGSERLFSLKQCSSLTPHLPVAACPLLALQSLYFMLPAAGPNRKPTGPCLSYPSFPLCTSGRKEALPQGSLPAFSQSFGKMLSPVTWLLEFCGEFTWNQGKITKSPDCV